MCVLIKWKYDIGVSESCHFHIYQSLMIKVLKHLSVQILYIQHWEDYCLCFKIFYSVHNLTRNSAGPVPGAGAGGGGGGMHTAQCDTSEAGPSYHGDTAQPIAADTWSNGLESTQHTCHPHTAA